MLLLPFLVHLAGCSGVALSPLEGPAPDAGQDVIPEAGTLCLVPSPAAGYVTVPCPADLQDGGMGYTRVTDAVRPREPRDGA